MENRTLSLVFVAVFVVSLVSGLQFTHNAAGGFFDLIYLPEITINKDGSVTPETSLISVSGNVYTLTGDVDGYSIVIERSNMVFDGSGFTINATSGDNPGLKMMNANGVTIRDVNVYGRYKSVQLYLCSKCQLIDIHATGMSLDDYCNSNTITKCTTQRLTMGSVFGSNNSIVTANNITREFFVKGYNNTFSRNNFVLTEGPGIYTSGNTWDDGAVGNYWGNNSDWRVNATQIGYTGVSDTPYVIQRNTFVSKMYPNVTCIDNFPLLYAYDIENNLVSLPTPTISPNDTTDDVNPKPATDVFVPLLAIFVILPIVALLILLQRRKRR